MRSGPDGGRAGDPLRLSIASGVLLGLTFTPLGGPLLPFVAFAPLGAALERRSAPGDGLVPGFVVAAVGHGIGLQWMVPALSWRTPLAIPVWLGVLCLIGLVAALAVESALRLYRRSRLPLAAGLGLSWAGLEWLAAHMPVVPYGWLNAGGSLVWWSWASDWIALGGTPLMTVWTVGVGIGVGRALSRRRWGGLLPAACAALLPVLVGTLISSKAETGGTPRSVIGVQPGRTVPAQGAGLLSWQEEVSRASDGVPPDLVVFPERFLSSSPDSLTGDGRLAEALGAPVLFGAVDSLEAGPARGGVANAAFLARPERPGRQVAHKRRLVPWLESGGTGPGGAGYQRGERAVVFDLGGWRVGTLICYDVAFPSLARDLVRRGADALVVISNDDWLDPEKPPRTTVAYWQHETLGRLRAVENRTPLVQVATTGRTFSVDSRGQRYPVGGGSGPPALERAVVALRVRTGTGSGGVPNQAGLLGLVGVLTLALGAWPERVRGVPRRG